MPHIVFEITFPDNPSEEVIDEREEVLSGFIADKMPVGTYLESTSGPED